MGLQITAGSPLLCPLSICHLSYYFLWNIVNPSLGNTFLFLNFS